MTFRKRRNPTPGFRLTTPFQPLTGEHATLQSPGLYPYFVLMQVAAEDTKASYCICRGFDTRINKFIDYEEGNVDKPGIPVAKPYGARTTGVYAIGEIHAAGLPTQASGSTVPPSPTTAQIRLGQNPGKAATSADHPADLTEALELLETDDGKKINWMFIGGADTLTIVKQTSDTKDGTSGFYPGKLLTYDVSTGTLTEGDDIWIEDLNDL